MDKALIEKIVSRYIKIFLKDKNYYAFNYDLPYTVDEKGKKKFVKKPWFIEKELTFETYKQHLVCRDGSFHTKTKIDGSLWITDWGIILPPINEKGEVSYGAIDVDFYNDPKLIERIIKQIYEEELPLAPCYSNSGGLHLYLFSKEPIQAKIIIKILQHYNKHLGIKAKEVFPKQEKLKWLEKKKRFEYGNGIHLPYRSCIHEKTEQKKIDSEDIYKVKILNNITIEERTPNNPWIKSDMSKGSIEEFLDYAESILIDETIFDSLPLNLPKEKEDKTEEKITEEKTDFTEPNARPLSSKNPLTKIIQNIKNKKEHHRGGTFDNHVVDFIYGAMESKISDEHIHEYLSQFEDPSNTYDKSWKDYIQDKINNCRDKYDKADPGPLREGYMGDTIYILNAKTKKFYNKKTGRAYDKESYNVKFADIFPKKIEPTDFFKDHPKKQLAEEETYRPDLHKEDNPLIKGADGLNYLNSYKPGKIKPIKPETEGDIKPWNDLLEHVVPIKEEREFLLDWLAHIVQNPWVKNRVIILIYTKKQRFGKGSIFSTMEDVLGDTNAEPTDVKGIIDKGAMFAEKQFILIDECKSLGGWGEKSNLVNDLKKIATETRIQQRKLYVDYQIIETQTCYIVFTNEPDALNMDKEDERYMVIKNENPKKDKSWYKAYHKWRKDKGSSYVYYMLKNRNIKHFDPNAPAPHTKAKEEMQEDTGHPLTLKLREMLEEGRYPLTLDTKIIGSTELAEYIGEYHRGNHVKYANDTKQMKRSLKDMGAIELGQVLHKQLNYKPSLWIVRDHEEMQKLPKPKICNEIWKPISTDSSPSEKHHEDATDRFMNNQTNGAEVFEKSFSTNCWACGSKIDTDRNEKCPECNFAIKCHCGVCVCDKPNSTVKKLPQYTQNR